MDFGKILSDSKVSLVRNIITLTSSFLLISIITQHVGEAEYGIWVTVLTVVGVFTAVGGGHMHGALIRYSPEEERPGQTLSDTGFLLSIIAIIATLIFTILSFSIDVLPFGDISPNRSLSILSISCLIITMIVSNFLKNYPRSKGNVVVYEKIEIAYEAGYLIMLPLIFLRTENILLAIWSLSSLNLLLIVIMLAIYYPEWLHTPKTSEFIKYYRYSLPMIPKQLSSRIFGQADRYMILIFISPTAVAIYTVVDQIVRLFRILSGILNPTLYPSVSAAWEAGEYTEIETLYTSVLRGYAILCIPALAGLYLLGPTLLEIIATPTIATEGAQFVLLLGLGYLIWGAENPIAYILSASEQTEKIAAITVFTAIGNVILNIILLPTIGLIGAVIATVSMQILKTTYMFFEANQVISLDLPVLTIVRTAVATLVMSGLLVLLPLDGSVLSILIYPIFGSICYFIVLILLRELRLAEIQNVLGI